MIKIANLEKNKEGNIVVKIMDKELEEIDLNKLYDSLNIVSEYNRIKNIYTMTIENGEQLYNCLKNVKEDTDTKLDTNKSEKQVMEANRTIFNYCSAIGMYIDIIEKSLSKIDKEKLKEFRKTCNELYDTELEYRFFVILRNFVVHYDLPFTAYEKTLYGSNIICEKQHLLKFKSWKHVRADIEQMPSKIEIRPMINKMNVSLTVLLFDYLYHISKKVIEAYEEASKFVIKYDLKNPCLVKYKSIEEYKKGNVNLCPIDFEGLQKVFDEVRKHPHINIKINNISL